MEAPRAIFLLLLTICSLLLIIPVAKTETYAELMDAMRMKSWEISKGQPNLESGKRLSKYGETPEKLRLSKPEEQGTYLEGDILFQRMPSLTRSLRNGNQYRWPGRIVYYKLDAAFTAAEKTMIKNAMIRMAQRTCIQFKVRSRNIPDYVLITRKSEGCHSEIGRQGGVQHLNLQAPDCISTGVIQHELMHTLGFFHEHARTDRDTYVTIDFSNILPEYVHNFNRMDDTNHLGIPYDYQSIMHYSRYAFASNKTLPTINIITETVHRHGRENKMMTPLDYDRITKMYDCRTTSTTVQPRSRKMGCWGKFCGV